MTEFKWLLCYGILVYVNVFVCVANDQEKLCVFYQFFTFQEGFSTLRKLAAVYSYNSNKFEQRWRFNHKRPKAHVKTCNEIQNADALSSDGHHFVTQAYSQKIDDGFCPFNTKQQKRLAPFNISPEQHGYNSASLVSSH